MTGKQFLARVTIFVLSLVLGHHSQREGTIMTGKLFMTKDGSIFRGIDIEADYYKARQALYNHKMFGIDIEADYYKARQALYNHKMLLTGSDLASAVRRLAERLDKQEASIPRGRVNTC